MSDDVPEPSEADKAINLVSEYEDAGEEWRRLTQAIIRRCHAAESALAAARRTIVTLEAGVVTEANHLAVVEHYQERIAAAERERDDADRAAQQTEEHLTERLAAIERETVERCAAVADEWSLACKNGVDPKWLDPGARIAAVIRSLPTNPQQ